VRERERKERRKERRRRRKEEGRVTERQGDEL